MLSTLQGELDAYPHEGYWACIWNGRKCADYPTNSASSTTMSHSFGSTGKPSMSAVAIKP
jgi:hypothetical protein